MILLFSRRDELITLFPERGLGFPLTYPAANNVDSHSGGPWPEGVYHADALLVTDPTNKDAIRRYGIYRIRFVVPGRTGMEFHAGEVDVPDGLGRMGYLHCTEGCIRGTPDAVAQAALWYRQNERCTIAVVD